MAKKKKKKLVKEPVIIEKPPIPAAETVESMRTTEPDVVTEMGIVVEEAPTATATHIEVCDTCKREGRVLKCGNCGATYCNRCRTPHRGHYPTCQFCEEAL